MKLQVVLFALAGSLTAQTASPPQAPAAPPRLYAVRLTTGPAWDTAKLPNEQAGMKEHSANIARMRRDGVLVLGARIGDTGLLVLRVPDEAAARAQFADDPTVATGVFKA